MVIEISKAAFEEILPHVGIQRLSTVRNRPVAINMEGIVLMRDSREEITIPIEQPGIPFMVEDNLRDATKVRTVIIKHGPDYRYED
jgi:hypothetical protein